MATTNDRIIVAVPGILARCEEQHKPLWLERFAKTVNYFDYDKAEFDADHEIARLTGFLEHYMSAGQQVTVIGSSCGGNVTTFALHRLLQKHPQAPEYVSAILVDAPCGIETLNGLKGQKPGLVMSKFGHGLTLAVGAVTALVNKTGQGLPKDEFITRPDDDVMHRIAGRADFTDAGWRDVVKQIAKANLRGHTARQFSDMLQFMVKIGHDISLEYALTEVNDYDIIYVQCVRGNDVVVQPLAQQRHLERLRSVNSNGSPRWVTVKATHCGYLQMQAEFEAAFVPLLGR